MGILTQLDIARSKAEFIPFWAGVGALRINSQRRAGRGGGDQETDSHKRAGSPPVTSTCCDRDSTTESAARGVVLSELKLRPPKRLPA